MTRTEASKVQHKVFLGSGAKPQRALKRRVIKIGKMQFKIIAISATGDHEAEEDLNPSSAGGVGSRCGEDSARAFSR